MGFGTGGGGYNTVCYFSAKSPTDADAYFRMSKGTDGGDFVEQDNQQWVEGSLERMEILNKEHKGVPYKVLRLRLEDDPGMLFIVDVPVGSFIGREFVNRLLSATTFGKKVKVVLYTSDPPEGKDRGFNHISIQINGKKPGLPPTYIDDEFKSMFTEYKVKGGGTGRDYADQEAKLLKELEEKIMPLVGRLIDTTEKQDPDKSAEAALGKSDEFPADSKPDPDSDPDRDEKDDLPF